MHEMALARDLLRKISEAAKERGVKRPTSAKVRLGETRVHDRTELEELFNLVSKGTELEGINLELTITPLKAECAKCGSAYDSRLGRIECNVCGSKEIKVTQGNEILVEEIK